jgi:dCTP deaminase
MTHYDIGDDRAPGRFAKTHYVPFSTEYVLHPHGFVLGTTLEWLRLPKRLFAYVIGKSSWGRRGLIIATATAVHPGFTGCLTLELSNVGELPIVIYPGMPICQLCVHRVEEGEEDAPVDGSRFVGFRRPVVGQVSLDATARTLRNQ